MSNKQKCGAMHGTDKKFTIIKDEDIEKYLNETEKDIFKELINKIILSRLMTDGKESNNEYLVINTDEPYTDKVIEIMKKYGHAK